MTLDFYDVSCYFHHSWRSLMMFAPAPSQSPKPPESVPLPESQWWKPQEVFPNKMRLWVSHQIQVNHYESLWITMKWYSWCIYDVRSPFESISISLCLVTKFNPHCWFANINLKSMKFVMLTYDVRVQIEVTMDPNTCWPFFYHQLSK